jgi:hypothetical protein
VFSICANGSLLITVALIHRAIRPPVQPGACPRDQISRPRVAERSCFPRAPEVSVMRCGLNFFSSFRLQDLSTAEYFVLGLWLSDEI